MVAIALLCAVTCYAGAMVLAATPLARPMGPPVGRVVAVLGAGVLAHAVGVILLAHAMRVLPIAGLGPALSFAGLALAAALLVAEMLAQDVTLALVGAPLAAFATGAAIFVGLDPRHPGQPHGLQGLWLVSHIALSFVGIAALATAGTAGTLYLVERRELKERRFGRVFRLFPPLETLDRVNHLASVIGWVGLTAGMLLAASYAVAYGLLDGPRIIWGVVAWCAASVVAMGRLLGGWRARRAAIAAAVAWALVIVTYVAARALAGRPGTIPVSGYPILLDGERVSALVVGGGAVAHRKALGLLESGATVRVVAVRIGAAVRVAARRHRRLTLVERGYVPTDIGMATLVVAATDSRAVNARIAADAVAAGRLINVADAPAEGNCATMAVHRAGSLVIGVAAGGVPVAARRIRDALAERFDGRYGAALAALAALRSVLRAQDPPGWSEAARLLIGPDFCAAVESGACTARVAEWR